MGWWGKKKKRNLERGAMLLEDLIECCDGKSNPIKFFSARQIRRATNEFSFSNSVFHSSQFWLKWYTGKTENHPMILIKRYIFTRENYYRDIAISSMVSGHKNFMKLVGCCLEFEDLVLVYNGVKKHYQVDHIIRELQWEKRMKIAEDIATALAYLHTAFPRPFVYRNMWIENILLDEDGVAKLSDFSYCVSIPKGETFVKVNLYYYGDIYKDSKYMRDGVVSVETDVYAFGMLMQKLLHGYSEVWVEDLFHRITGKEIYDDSIIERDDQIYIQNGLLKLMEERRLDTYPDLKILEELGLSKASVERLIHRFPGKDISDDSIVEREVQRRYVQNWLLKLMEEGRIDEIVDPKMLEMMGEISEEELCQMKAFLMLSQRCISEVEVPTMVEVAKELKKIQRSLKTDSSSPSGETKFHSPQDIASSSQTRL